ncbi:hypothetical protein MPOCJGCO_0711 [Methylobacterium trifolii]|uniref:Uncharacterized protein n=1 Tax=Methylobacterium trifolii TaxID=1003092 RepID=A0ABQ4TUN6_9HYPH|nr:hypothetical protein MPOCJGCO_0711 [Methylobacterium trifolii]
MAASASAVASLFTGRPPSDPSLTAAGTALAYAPALSAVPSETVEVPLPPRRPASLSGADVVQVTSLVPDPVVPVQTAQAPAATQTVDVPLPPRRPDDLGGPVQVASLAPAATHLAGLRLSSQPEPAAAPVATATEAVEVPLPPRRPSVQMLAAIARPVVVARKAPAAEPVREATALPPAQ